MKIPALHNIHGPNGMVASEQKKLKSACEEFEAVLTNILFKSMRETIPKANADGEANAMGLYESMLDESVAQELSHGPGLGLGKLLYQQLSSQIKPKS